MSVETIHPCEVQGRAGREDPHVEQAKGILAVTFGITPEEALVVMQAFAGQEFPTLAELAAHIVEVSTEPPAGPEAARRRLSLLLFAGGGPTA